MIMTVMLMKMMRRSIHALSPIGLFNLVEVQITPLFVQATDRRKKMKCAKLAHVEPLYSDAECMMMVTV